MKNVILSLVILLSVICTTQAQSFNGLTASVNPTKAIVGNNTSNEALKANVTSRDAMFPGGIKAMKKFIESNNNYKAVADESFAEGMVTLRFMVHADGSISEISVLKSDNTELNEAAINIIKAMPNWEPAVSEGYYTARRIVLPIYFRLR